MDYEIVKHILNVLYESPFSVFFDIYVYLVILDLFTGVYKAVILKRLNSTIGLNGLFRHLTFILLVGGIRYFLYSLDLNVVLIPLFIMIYVAYFESIMENLIAIDFKYIPIWLKNRFDIDKINKLNNEKLNNGIVVKKIEVNRKDDLNE